MLKSFFAHYYLRQKWVNFRQTKNKILNGQFIHIEYITFISGMRRL